jgi:nucleoid-associated protein YgaU
VTNETSPVQASAQVLSGAGGIPAKTSTNGAAKVFREFKWGLLTLFLLMVVVIGLVYDGGRKKDAAKKAEEARAEQTPAPTAALPTEGLPPGLAGDLANPTAGSMDVGLNPARPSTAQNPGSSVVSPTIPTVPPGGIRPPDIAFHPPGTPTTPATVPGPTQLPGIPTTVDTTNAREYVVQSGDTLEAIARRNYPGRTYTAIKAISEANSISDPRRIRVGMKLKMPALPAQDQANRNTPPTPGATPTRPENRQVAEPLTPSTPRTNAQPEEGDVYLVQGGDTLERIARKVLNDVRRWREIYEWNRDQLHDPGVLRIGQKLKIKKDTASPTAASPAEANRQPAPEQPAQAPRRTVAAREETATTEEPSSQPQTIERVEPLQRWMP